MLDHRVYRAAFVPALVALLIVAFSLGDRPGPRTTRIAPDVFSSDRAFGTGASPAPGSLLALAADAGSRRPGSAGDRALADVVVRELERRQEGDRPGFVDRGEAERLTLEAETVDGKVPIEAVIATRQGLSAHTIAVIAHRDARRGPAVAELSGTAALLELGRVFAEGDLPRTLVLASVSGGSGGFAGARAVAERLPGTVDAVLVLGDLASVDVRRPFVVPWAAGGKPAPHGLRRTVEAALREETGVDPGGARLPAQWVRRTFPLTLGEQGVVNGSGLPAVLVSATGERGPAPAAEIDGTVFAGFGRGILRAVRAMQVRVAPDVEADGPLFAGGEGVVTVRRLLPDWAVRLLGLALLLPALLAAIDGFFRVRRRGLPMGKWLLWALTAGLPFVLGWGWMRLVDVTGAVPVLGQPAAPDALPIEGPEIAVMAAVPVVIALGWFGLRPLLLRGLGVRGEPSAGGGSAAVGLCLALLALAVWIFNPYAAIVLLPAVHLWLLVAAPESRLRGLRGAAAVLVGLVLPVLVAVLLAHGMRLGLLEALWVGFQAFAGGAAGPPAALALSFLAGLGCCVLAIVARRQQAATRAPEDRITTRGPRSYAGPGSLGGTESALRR